MSRYFAPISKEDFVKKLMTEVFIFEEDEDPNDKWARPEIKLEGNFVKDLGKVSFDFENWEWKEGQGHLNYPCGYMQLDNGMHCWFVTAGGDWEWPVCFVIYWDGKSLRGYIPKEGNVWNRKNKQAFGNDEEDDEHGINSLLQEAKHWVDENVKKEIDELKPGEYDTANISLDILSSQEAIIRDIKNRIQSKK